MPLRTRVEDLMVQSCPCTRYNTFHGSPEQIAGNVNWGFVGTARGMTDFSTPNFKKVRDGGSIVNSPMTSYNYSVTNKPKSFAMHRKVLKPYVGDFVRARWTDFSSYCLSLKKPVGGHLPTFFLSLDTSSMTTSAVTSAFAKVGSPDIQSLVSLAEGKQTLALLRNPLQGVIAMLKSSKYKNINLGRMSQGAAQQWLATNFGILPMIMDIQGIMRALSRRVEERVRETARARETDTKSSDTVRLAYEDTMFRAFAQRVVVDTATVRAGVLYEHQLTLADRLGMTATYIPASIWEHLPWSFVVDYFLNIGDVINAFTPKASTNTLAAWVSTERYCTVLDTIVSESVVHESTGWTITDSMVGASMEGVYRTKVRNPVNRSDSGFAINLSLSNRRVVNLLALLTQQLTTKR